MPRACSAWCADTTIIMTCVPSLEGRRSPFDTGSSIVMLRHSLFETCRARHGGHLHRPATFAAPGGRLWRRGLPAADLRGRPQLRAPATLSHGRPRLLRSRAAVPVEAVCARLRRRQRVRVPRAFLVAREDTHCWQLSSVPAGGAVVGLLQRVAASLAVQRPVRPHIAKMLVSSQVSCRAKDAGPSAKTWIHQQRGNRPVCMLKPSDGPWLGHVSFTHGHRNYGLQLIPVT